jgi:hypothetical protein
MVENITPAAKVFHCKSVGLAVIANVKRGQADLPDLVFIPFLTAEPVREKKRTNPQHPLHIILVLVQDALLAGFMVAEHAFTKRFLRRVTEQWGSLSS